MPHSSVLAYLGNPLDRCANQRSDEAWLERLLKQPTTRHIHMNGDKTFVRDGKLQAFPNANTPDCVLLGVDADGTGWFASPAQADDTLMDLRSLAVA